MTRLVFLDTETTGLGPYRQPWDFGLIVRDEDGTEVEHQWLAEVDLTHAEPAALEIGGFHRRHPKGIAMAADEPYVAFQGTLSVYMSALRVYKLTDKAVVIANNPHFDLPMLERVLRGFGFEPTWHYRPLDVIAMAAGRYCRPPIPPFRSEEISEYAGITPPQGADRHTALGDARWVRDLWDELTRDPS